MKLHPRWTTNNLFLSVLLLLIAFVSTKVTPPDVRWSCSPSSVSIFVRTEKPFEGIIKARDSASESCLTRGIGTNLAVLKLSFNQQECGITHDKDEDIYKLTVDVHSHPILIVDEDESLNISCRTRRNISLDDEPETSPLYRLEVLDQETQQQVQQVHYASPYIMKISNIDDKKFTVGECSARAGVNHTVQLTDTRGCSLYPSLLGHFERSQNTMSAVFPTMFRFPQVEEMTLTCHVLPCDGTCESHDCSPSSDSTSIADILEQTTTMEVESDDIPSVSVVVKMLDKKTIRKTPEKSEDVEDMTSSSTTTSSPALAQYADDSKTCATPADVDMMYHLCIFLAVCSTIGFTINIIFGCLLWRRRHPKTTTSSPRPQKTSSDFWIMDNNNKTVNDMEAKYYAPPHPPSSFASVKHKPRRAPLPIVDFGMSASRSSESSSSYGADIYRRPENNRHSQSTFTGPPTTLETDVDSCLSSNQTSSYH